MFCMSKLRVAPVGCLQYFEDTAGTISSFNYNSNVDGTNTNQISNMNYAICIRAANGFCGIRYSQVRARLDYLTKPSDVMHLTKLLNTFFNFYK